MLCLLSPLPLLRLRVTKNPTKQRVFLYIPAGCSKVFYWDNTSDGFFLVYIREKIIVGEVQEKDPLIISKVQK